MKQPHHAIAILCSAIKANQEFVTELKNHTTNSPNSEPPKEVFTHTL